MGLLACVCEVFCARSFLFVPDSQTSSDAGLYFFAGGCLADNWISDLPLYNTTGTGKDSQNGK